MSISMATARASTNLGQPSELNQINFILHRQQDSKTYLTVLLWTKKPDSPTFSQLKVRWKFTPDKNASIKMTKLQHQTDTDCTPTWWSCLCKHVVHAAVPSPCRAAVVPGARLHADTPRGPPLLTGLNPTVYWCRNQLSPVRREWEEDSRDTVFCN